MRNISFFIIETAVDTLANCPCFHSFSRFAKTSSCVIMETRRACSISLKVLYDTENNASVATMADQNYEHENLFSQVLSVGIISAFTRVYELKLGKC